MIDLPISHSPSVHNAGKTAATFEWVIARFRAAFGILAQATARNAHRLAPEEVLAAQARREEARRAVDRLLQRR